jgi:hypothetical protein
VNLAKAITMASITASTQDTRPMVNRVSFCIEMTGACSRAAVPKAGMPCIHLSQNPSDLELLLSHLLTSVSIYTGKHMRALLPYLLRRGVRMVFSFFRRNSTQPKASIETEITRDVMDAEVADINLVSDEELEDSAASLPPMTAFDLVVVGAGGGPDESNLSAYVW